MYCHFLLNLMHTCWIKVFFFNHTDLKLLNGVFMCNMDSYRLMELYSFASRIFNTVRFSYFPCELSIIKCNRHCIMNCVLWVNKEYLALVFLNYFRLLQEFRCSQLNESQHLVWVDSRSPQWFQCYCSEGLNPYCCLQPVFF